MLKPELGKLEKINLRQAWRHEATEFTPWLAQEENLNQLADTLGLSDLELVQTEHTIGDFKLDILCTDDQGEVIIENQLEPTDHKHLGQLLTYAAGIEANKVIWVAESFRPEHIAALEFLNHNTTSTLSFFAVEIALWKIGDSAMAPSFNVVVKPNDWSKTNRESARAASASSPIKQQQLKFWTEWSAYLTKHVSLLKPQKAHPRHWITLSAGRTGYSYSATLHSREDRLGAELYIKHPDSKEHFAQLAEQKDKIEQELGFALDWQELPNKHACRIVTYKSGVYLEDESNWQEGFAWLTTTLEKMQKVFRPFITSLD